MSTFSVFPLSILVSLALHFWALLSLRPGALLKEQAVLLSAREPVEILFFEESARPEEPAPEELPPAPEEAEDVSMPPLPPQPASPAEQIQSPPPAPLPRPAAVSRMPKALPKPAGPRTPSSKQGSSRTEAAAASNNPPPIYPELARRNGWEGRVILRVSVDSSGRPVAVTISKGSGFRILDEAALRAVRTWKFQPRRVNGQAVEAELEVPVNFALRR